MSPRAHHVCSQTGKVYKPTRFKCSSKHWKTKSSFANPKPIVCRYEISAEAPEGAVPTSETSTVDDANKASVVQDEAATEDAVPTSERSAIDDASAADGSARVEQDEAATEGAVPTSERPANDSSAAEDSAGAIVIDIASSVPSEQLHSSNREHDMAAERVASIGQANLAIQLRNTTRKY